MKVHSDFSCQTWEMQKEETKLREQNLGENNKEKYQ